MAQIAISTDFLQAFAQIPRSQQKKVRAFVEKFKADPTQASINYEPIHNMADDKVRTVRIDQAYRAIVIHPPNGDVYAMVWVDHHDEAMAWAKKKRFEVNVQTGSFQVWEVLEQPPLERSAVSQTMAAPLDGARELRAISTRPMPEESLFRGHTDDALLLFGVPEPLLPAVRAVRDETGLDLLARYLPGEAVDALYMLAAGYGVEDAIDELGRRSGVAQAVDENDFGAAMERPGSQRQFKVVQSEADLAELLASPLDTWRIFLHPAQREVVEMHSEGSIRVLGGAGTGKTVVAIHRARYLAGKPGFLRDGEQILVTTFTRNLAADIERSLDLLCREEERNRIVVRNLHAEAWRIVEATGELPQLADEATQQALWEEVFATEPAAGLSPEFYRDEWRMVVQAQDITTEEAYLQVRRGGRGTALGTAQRKAVWRVFAAYRKRLTDRCLVTHEDVVREARLWLIAVGNPIYRAVVADEVQDFRQAELALLRALVPEADNDIFVVGDAHQRIYGHRASLQRAGIDVRGERTRRLHINYRTTQHIRAWAMAILEGLAIDDLDEGQDDARGYHSLRRGQPPLWLHGEDAADEEALILAQVQRWRRAGVDLGDICLVARTNRVLEGYGKALSEAGIPVGLIQKEAGFSEHEGVRLATMHRVKGLEFRYVIVAGVQEGMVPLDRALEGVPDELAREARLQGERQLLYVAATRARDGLVVTGHGAQSPFLTVSLPYMEDRHSIPIYGAA